MRAVRKCGPTRVTHSTRFSIKLLGHPPRSPLQNRPELLVSFVSAVVAESIFIQVGLQISGRNRVVNTADPTLNQAPKSLYGVGVNVSNHIHAGSMANPLVIESRKFSILRLHPANSIIDAVFIGIDSAARSNVVTDDA